MHRFDPSANPVVDPSLFTRQASCLIAEVMKSCLKKSGYAGWCRMLLMNSYSWQEQAGAHFQVTSVKRQSRRWFLRIPKVQCFRTTWHDGRWRLKHISDPQSNWLRSQTCQLLVLKQFTRCSTMQTPSTRTVLHLARRRHRCWPSLLPGWLRHPLRDRP